MTPLFWHCQFSHQAIRIRNRIRTRDSPPSPKYTAVTFLCFIFLLPDQLVSAISPEFYAHHVSLDVPHYVRIAAALMRNLFLGVELNLSALAVNKLLNAYYSFNTLIDNYKTQKFTEVKHEVPFHGGFVIVMALFEKRKLRHDVAGFLKAAKEHGAFVIGVNTLRLDAESFNSGLFDVYIERDNFGRDFGSYQAGFSYLFDNDINKNCQRVMMINDSIYFSKKGMPEFIKLMSSSQSHILGATENYDDIHHLGSFCISFSQKVVSDPRFIAYWQEYKRTNVRPRIIRKGEMELTSMLHRVNPENGNLPVAYDFRRLERMLQDDRFLQSYVLKTRWGDDRIVISKSISEYLETDKSALDFYLANAMDVFDLDKIKIKSNKELRERVLNDISISEFIGKIDFNHVPFAVDFRRSIVALCLKAYTDSSQIHSNCVSLYSMGLPIIKIDLLYRSLASYGDIERIKQMLPDDEKDDFLSRVTAKGPGHNFLRGFQKLSFDYGYI